MRKSILAGLAVVLALGAFAALNRWQYETPILMYHHIDYDPERSGVYVSASIFESQMEFLKVHDYHVVPLEEVIKAAKEGRSLSPKTVAITFDDGYLDNFKNAFPVLRKMGFPATIFVITDNIGKEDWLAEEDLKILSDSAVTIGSHTVGHSFLPNIRDKEQIALELKNSKERLEQIVGKPVTLFSYPAGGFDSRIKEAVRQAGYEGAVTTNYVSARYDPYALRRIKISEGGGNLFRFWVKLSGFYTMGRKKAKALTDDAGSS